MLIGLPRLRWHAAYGHHAPFRWQSESDVKREVQKLRERIYDAYAESVGLDAQACYLHGTPLRPVVPLDAAQGGLFVIGAYPSARFHLIDGVNDVPVADNLGPFESERWFDGARVRQQPSAVELPLPEADGSATRAMLEIW